MEALSGTPEGAGGGAQAERKPPGGVSPGAPGARRAARWRYAVPNAITLAGLLIGLLATFRAMQGRTEEAGWLIILTVLLDKLDGSAARVLRATSKIGVQLDSFADFVNFGIAPGALLFATLHGGELGVAGAGGALPPAAVEASASWQGSLTGPLLYAASAIYVLSACVRLAKFNVLTFTATGPRVFYGVPSTLVGGTMALMFILGVRYDSPGLLTWTPALAVLLAALMLSNIPLPKVGKTRSRMVNVWQLVNGPLSYVAGVLRIWPEYLLAMVVIYLAGGLGWGLIHRRELMPTRSLDVYPDTPEDADP